jgi:hypothetical protein
MVFASFDAVVGPVEPVVEAHPRLGRTLIGPPFAIGRIPVLVILREILAAAARAVAALALTVALGGPVVAALAPGTRAIVIVIGPPLRTIFVGGPLPGPRRIVIRHLK